MAKGPEAKIQAKLRDYLESRGWQVEVMHGNAYQSGIPDLYLFHPKYKERWVDCKVEGKYEFTKAQRIKWPQWESKGIGIWILTGADQDQYDRLFRPPNMRDYWKSRYDPIMSVDDALDLVDQDTTPTVSSYSVGDGVSRKPRQVFDDPWA